MMNVNTGQHFKDEKISVNNVFFFFFLMEIVVLLVMNPDKRPKMRIELALIPRR